MIRLITGLPGAGKSLRAVWYIKQGLDEGRPVYVHGVNGLVPMGWQECDPRAWQELPDGALVVVDEAQEVWPTRRAGDPEPSVRALSKHRHRGFDFVLLTQHPTMLDAYVRKLVGEHQHLLRVFGAQAARIVTWSEAYDDPQSQATRDRGTASLWRYPRELYDMYKSATMHTVKRRIPLRLKLLPVGLLLIVVLAWGAARSIGGLSDVDPTAAAVSAGYDAARGSAPSGGGAYGPRGPGAKYADPESYAAAFVPRIPAMPWSAPAFDDRAPAADPELLCIVSEVHGCRCYTEQITRVAMPILDCHRIAREGTYNPFRRPFDRPAVEGGRQVGDAPSMGRAQAVEYEPLPAPVPRF